MIELLKDLKGSKTFWLCVAGIGACVQQGLAGEITWRQAASGAFACVIGITMRHALDQSGAAEAPKPASPENGVKP